MTDYVKRGIELTENFSESLDEVTLEGAGRMLVLFWRAMVEEFLGRGCSSASRGKSRPRYQSCTSMT